MEELGRTSFQCLATWDHRPNTQKTQFLIPGDVTGLDFQAVIKKYPGRGKQARGGAEHS